MTPAGEPNPLADKLVQTLRARKEQGDYPTTLRRLGEAADPQATDQVLTAATEEPFKSAAVVAHPKNLDSPVAFRDDLATLAASPRLLEFVLEQVCTEDKPLTTAEKLAKTLDADLRTPFAEAVARMAQDQRLPESVAARSDDKGLQLYLKRMPPRLPGEKIVERLLATLEGQGRPGSPEFPLTPRRLLELAGLEPEGRDGKKALAAPGFADRVVAAVKKNLDSPLALRQDQEALAANPRLLDFVLHLVCSEDKPLCPLDKVTAKVDLDVRGPFTEKIAQQLDEKTLPEGVGTTMLKGGPALYLKKWPQKPPADVALAQKLVATLEQAREQGREAYPLTVSQMVRRAGVDADAGLLKKAFGKEPYFTHVAVAMPKSPDSPVALIEDANALAGSPLLLEALLTVARTGDNHAQTLPDLMKRVSPSLQGPFESAVAKWLETATLPAAVGSVMVKGKAMLFLKADVGRKPEPKPVVAAAPPESEPISFTEPALSEERM